MDYLTSGLPLTVKRLLLPVLLLISIEGITQIAYPVAPSLSQVDTIFGVIVKDPYRQLEVTNEATLIWQKQQADLTNRYKRKELRDFDAVLTKWRTYRYADYNPLAKEGDFYYFLQYDRPDTSPNLYRKKTYKSTPGLLVDPFVFSDRDHRASIANFEVSHNEQYLAFALSNSGSDWREIRIKDVSKGKYLPDVIKWVKYSGIGWKDDGFYYWRYDAPAKGQELLERVQHQKLFYHKVNTSQDQDKFIYGVADEGDSRSSFEVTSDEKYLLLQTVVGSGDSLKEVYHYKELDSNSEFEIMLKQHDSRIANKDSEFAYSVIDHVDGKFYMITNEDANNYKLITFDIKTKTFATIVPEYSNLLQRVSIIGKRIVALYYFKGKYDLVIFDLQGNTIQKIPFKDGYSVDGLAGDNDDTETLYSVHSFYFPSVFYKLDLTTNDVEPISSTFIMYDHSQFETRYIRYPSKDGTEIPMYLTYKIGTNLTSGANPVLLYGYGGFGVSLKPEFDPGHVLFMERGGVLATPQIRGGGEFGEQWHNAGKNLNKQNSFDDFISAAEFLIKINLTNSSRIAINGGSNGGLLVAAAMTQRPELFKAVVAEMGVMDMLRFDKFGIGYVHQNEYGSIADSTEFKNLYRYSPVHNVKANVTYPATLLITSDNDDRVPPLHSYKFIAALQEGKLLTDGLFLLYVNDQSGHYGSTTIDGIHESEALKFSFIFKQLGIKF